MFFVAEVKQGTHLMEIKEAGLKEPTEKGADDASIVAVIQLIGVFVPKLFWNNRAFAVRGHVTTPTLTQSVMTKWCSEMERTGLN